MKAWPAPHGAAVATTERSVAAPTSRSVALVSENRGQADQVTAALQQRYRLRTQPWRAGPEAFEPERIVKEMVTFDDAVVCIGDDVPLRLALDIATEADREAPDLSVILLHDPTSELWREAVRAGVRDVISPATLGVELLPSVQTAFERVSRRRTHATTTTHTPTPGGRVIVVLSPKGGSGKTMVAANLAAALTKAGAESVAVVDLDVQFGDSSLAFGLTPEHTLGQLVGEPTIDSTTLKVFLTPHPESGAFVLCASHSPEEADSVTDDHTVRIVQLLARDFAYVIVDTPAGLDERTLASLEVATDAVLVSTMDVSSIRALGKDIEILNRLGLLPDRRTFVLNRADSRVGLEPADVQLALGVPITAAVPSSRAVPVSMNQGRLLVVDQPNGPVAKEMAKLARTFVNGNGVPARSSGLFKRKKA